MVLGRTDERPAGLDGGAGFEPVVEHPAADPPPGLDQEHGPAASGHAAGGDEAGDAAADHDHVHLRGQRALERAGGHRVGEAAERQAARGQPGPAQQ